MTRPSQHPSRIFPSNMAWLATSAALLSAQALIGCSGSSDTPTPTGTPEVTPTAAPEATPTATQNPTPTDAPTATPTEAPTATPTEAPTATPTNPPTPTATPVPWNLDALWSGLSNPWRYDYVGVDAGNGGDGGLGHLTYWTLKNDPNNASDPYDLLPQGEKDKVDKMAKTTLQSSLVKPTVQVPGTEVTGTLTVEGTSGSRMQEVFLKLPAQWNGKLAVLAAPGVHTEYGSEKILSWWLLEKGYAVASGNKGMTNSKADGSATLQNGKHPTLLWGDMFLDVTIWAQTRLEEATGELPSRTYALGLSNGGYVVRRALELDNDRVAAGNPRLLDGGLDWAGAYWPSKDVMDTDQNGSVSSQELDSTHNLINDTVDAALAFKWMYEEGQQCTADNWAASPRYASVRDQVIAAGFMPESDILWGAYNTTFNYLAAYGSTYAAFKGVGYYNFTSYVYRADLCGDDSTEALAYTAYSFDGNIPPYYAFFRSEAGKTWSQECIDTAIALANTGVFSVPLISIQGAGDALLGTTSNQLGYVSAVESEGNPELYHHYVVNTGNHVDLHADGLALDYDVDGTFGEEGAGAQLTPLQGYIQRGFEYLEDSVELGMTPPSSKTLTADPVIDVIDPALINFD